MNFGGDRADQRVLGLDDVAMRFEDLPNLLAKRRVVDGDDDFDGLDAATNRVVDRAIRFAVRVLRLGEHRSGGEREQADDVRGTTAAETIHAGQKSKCSASDSAESHAGCKALTRKMLRLRRPSKRNFR